MIGHGLMRNVRWSQRNLADTIESRIPLGSPIRKVLQLISVVLLIEGLSVILLFSYVGVWVGLGSFLIGVVLILLFFRLQDEGKPTDDTLGMRLFLRFTGAVGGFHGFIVLGTIIVTMVVVYNQMYSDRPSYGDVDVISLMFGGALLVFAFAPKRYRLEMVFSVVFLGFVVLFLVIPQILMAAMDGGDADPVGNWYVHYMLAAPFASSLDLLGIPASSSGNLVTLQFTDGSVHTLEISAYCAGLYSFAIFLSAFFAYVLVFESLRKSTLMIVMALGLLVAYLGNLLRMVVIGVAGYLWGIESLHWAHENVGWLIFMSWSAVFWWTILRCLGSPSVPAREPS